MDAKDSFRLCVGDEAYRKLASRDLQNQNILRSLNIPGLCTVPFTVIDYKGERIIGQGVIPGILAPQGDNFASLMYGVLERGKSLTVKNSSLLLMQTALKKLSIPTRTILRNPFPFDSPADSHMNTESTSRSPGSSVYGRDTPVEESQHQMEEQLTSIRIDTEDDVVMPAGSDSEVDSSSLVTHTGPIELKVLKGSDGRMYCLEVMRLTPRDANYVKGEKGTGKLAARWLDKTDDNLGIAYVLRRELVLLFIDNEIHAKRQELIMEFNRMHAAQNTENGTAVDGKEQESKEVAAAPGP
jgi:protein TIF31